VNEGALDMRRAKDFAATLDETWAKKSHDTFLRFIKLQSAEEPRLAFQMTAGKHAPIYVRKGVLRRLLDTSDRGAYSRLDVLESRVSDIEANISHIRRCVGLPPYAP
jgi:hypothetical protein